MTIDIIKCEFTICQIDSIEQVDFSQEFVFLSKTADEISLVCETCYVPQNVIACNHGWKVLKVSGVLEFDTVGVIAKIANILTSVDISIFVVSTYNTAYILLKSEALDKGVQALTQNGYESRGTVPSP